MVDAQVKLFESLATAPNFWSQFLNLTPLQVVFFGNRDGLASANPRFFEGSHQDGHHSCWCLQIFANYFIEAKWIHMNTIPMIEIEVHVLDLPQEHSTSIYPRISLLQGNMYSKTFKKKLEQTKPWFLVNFSSSCSPHLVSSYMEISNNVGISKWMVYSGKSY